MEDLDLDELDQAVNKMMDKPKGKKPAHKKDADMPGGMSTDMSMPAAPAFVADTPTPEPPKPEPFQRSESTSSAIPVNRPMPKVPPRRRMHPGAMDIIQPVSTSKTSAPSSVPTRTGRDISPTKDISPESPASPPISAPKPTLTPEEETVDVADEVLASLKMQDEPAVPVTITKPSVLAPTSVKKESGDNNWPDPLDFHDLNDTKPVVPSHPAEEPQEPKETPPTMEPKRTDPDALLEDGAAATPFVKIKVEKRPLGAYADATPQPTTYVEKPESVSVTDEAPSKGEMAAVAIQSNQHEAKNAEPEADMNNLRNMSIPPQYHTAEGRANEEVHNLFDTKEYHATPQQIAAHTVKKKGSMGLTVLIVVLVVLVIAAAAIGYFMMTGTLDLSKIL